ALVAKLGDRLTAVHVKDGVVPTTNPWGPGSADFTSESLDQRHAGTADVPLAAALRAGTGIEFAVIEYDRAPGDVFADIAASLAFLKD
ncbi:sugar phosphate isomerase/epimerase, partial [Streptomyces brasiliscabiei]